MFKTCFKCQQSLPLDSFYTHSAMADGRLGKCKECTRLDAIQHRRKHVERYREYDRGRTRLPHRLAKRKAITLRQQTQEPHKYRARYAAANARRDGRVEPEPCYFCASTQDIEVHHPDYARPLLVYWLCRICHRKLDKMPKATAARLDAEEKPCMDS